MSILKTLEIKNGDMLVLESVTGYYGWDDRLVYTIFYAQHDPFEPVLDNEGKVVPDGKVYYSSNSENYARFEDALAAFHKRAQSVDPFQAACLPSCVQRPEEWDEIMACCV